jgi:hypothetical protein
MQKMVQMTTFEPSYKNMMSQRTSPVEREVGLETCLFSLSAKENAKVWALVYHINETVLQNLTSFQLLFSSHLYTYIQTSDSAYRFGKYTAQYPYRPLLPRGASAFVEFGLPSMSCMHVLGHWPPTEPSSPLGQGESIMLHPKIASEGQREEFLRAENSKFDDLYL